MKKLQASSPLIGLMKWLAAQVIVAHHLASYGPFAQKGHAQMPQLFAFLSNCGAWAVSVFLVIAGFLFCLLVHIKRVFFAHVRVCTLENDYRSTWLHVYMLHGCIPKNMHPCNM